MNFLSVEKLSKTYGEKVLFDQITFGIKKGQKTALIARNGTGKSTLLNIIAGIESPDEGQVVLRNDIRIAYLPQIDHFPEHYSVLDTIFESETPIIAAVKEYETCMSLISGENNSQIQQRLEKAIVEMDRLQAWDFENKIKEILSKFGIHDIFRNIKELSGGERKKTALAKTLIAESDFLILDEPTNHLDIDMIEWIEDYLSSSNTTLLMVTHDRFFLDRVCNNIIELENGNLYQYKGKYDYYIEKKAERIAQSETQHEKLKLLYQKELAWVHTSPQARTTKAKARINAFSKLKEEASQKTENRTSAFKVKTERIGNKILEINNLNFSYPNLKLLDDFSYIFKKGEKCGVVGKNGSGKSTFLKLIMGELKAASGKITPGLTIKFGYFSQDGLSIKGNKRIIDLVKEEAEIIRTENGNFVSASQFLNNFGFKFEQQYAYYDDLSGGEKRKLHLLIVLMRNPNFLILDEPTNDFDIDTLNLLEDFLENFEGCMLVVSHDRWFMNKLVDHLFVFEGDGNIKDFYGNYTEYKVEKEREIRIQRKKEKATISNDINPAPPKKTSNKLTYKEKQEIMALEIEIEKIEQEKKEIVAKMNLGEPAGSDLTELAKRYQEIDQELDIKSTRWLELSEKDES